MNRRCPRCASFAIPVMRLATFWRPRCTKCGSKVGFNWIFELVFAFFTTVPIAVFSLLVVFRFGLVAGVVVMLGLVFALYLVAAAVAPLEIRSLRRGGL